MGTPLPITIGKNQDKDKIFSKEDSKQLENKRHFTDNDMRWDIIAWIYILKFRFSKY